MTDVCMNIVISNPLQNRGDGNKTEAIKVFSCNLTKKDSKLHLWVEREVTVEDFFQ